MNQAIVEDLVTASHILAGPGVLDGLASLGESAVVLLRGHGNAVVGETLQQVVYRAIQTELNARRQLQAMMLDGLELYGAEEAAKTNARSGPDAIQIGRTWELWKERSQRR